MKKTRIWFYIFCLIPALIFASSFFTFTTLKINNEHLKVFKDNLKEVIHKEASFNMKDVTPFAWDKMYVIQPYTPRDEMYKLVGIRWTTAKTYVGYLLYEKTQLGKYPLDDDSLHKLVFVKGNKVVLDVTLQRTEADFTEIKDVIHSSDAIFLVEKSEGRNPVIVKGSP